MKPEIKELWVMDLESGEYVQGFGQLEDHGRYCCLGVLCERFTKETGTDWKSLPSGKGHSLLPVEVENWSELYETGQLQVEGKELWRWNDKNRFEGDGGKDFNGIAQLIRESDL